MPPRCFLAASEQKDRDRDTLGRLTRCRSVTRDGRWSSNLPAGDLVAWHREWSRRSHDYGIVYGHWALQGLHVAPGLRGLDTGCVHHGRGRDGALTGPNLALYQGISARYPHIELQASGGVSSLADLQALQPTGATANTGLP